MRLIILLVLCSCATSSKTYEIQCEEIYNLNNAYDVEQLIRECE